MSGAQRGVELGYAEVTTTPSSTVLSTYEDVPGLSVTVNVGSRPIKVLFRAGQAGHSAAGGVVLVQIVEDGTTVRQNGSIFSEVANHQSALALDARLAPTAGVHTYKIQYRSNQAGTHYLTAAPTQPVFIEVVEI